jgi:hypothetical protein
VVPEGGESPTEAPTPLAVGHIAALESQLSLHQSALQVVTDTVSRVGGEGTVASQSRAARSHRGGPRHRNDADGGGL